MRQLVYLFIIMHHMITYIEGGELYLVFPVIVIVLDINRYIKAVSYLGKESSQEVKLLSPPLELGTTEVVAVFVGS